MCGIIGIASNKSVSENIIQSLKKLEYRGYDSAGIATIANNLIDEKKCQGRVDGLLNSIFSKLSTLPVHFFSSMFPLTIVAIPAES